MFFFLPDFITAVLTLCLVGLNSTIRILHPTFSILHAYSSVYLKSINHINYFQVYVWLYGCSVMCTIAKAMRVKPVKLFIFHSSPFLFSVCKAVGGRGSQGVVWGCGGARRAAGRGGWSTWILRIRVLLRKVIHQSPAASTHGDRERRSPETETETENNHMQFIHKTQNT